MNEWLLLLTAATLGSVISLIGGVLLLMKQVSVQRIQRIAVPFAAGALLAAALLDLLPEAVGSDIATSAVMALVLAGFVGFFMLERFLGWFHHHHDHDEGSPRERSTKPLIIIGDTVHNAIDGMVIGAAFLADPTIGVIATIAVAAHEIPQEIGDFGVLLALGMRRRNVLIVNLISALATIVFAALVYGLGSGLTGIEPMLLSLAAGMFIYIAASDLVPTIHEEPSIRIANIQTVIFVLGIVLVGTTTSLVHGFLEETGAVHSHADESDAHSHDH